MFEHRQQAAILQCDYIYMQILCQRCLDMVGQPPPVLNVATISGWGCPRQSKRIW